MSFLINPYAFLAAGGDFESIATVTVGSGGAANIEFTSIPSTFAHLQVRLVGRSTDADTDRSVRIQLNSDTGSNYARHELVGGGSSASAGGASSQSSGLISNVPAANATANIFGAFVLDVLDYASTSKATTMRCLGGNDRNGSGAVGIFSSLWTSTNAVTSVKLYPTVGDWAQHSTAALYGIKAP